MNFMQFEKEYSTKVYLILKLRTEVKFRGGDEFKHYMGPRFELEEKLIFLSYADLGGSF